MTSQVKSTCQLNEAARPGFCWCQGRGVHGPMVTRRGGGALCGRGHIKPSGACKPRRQAKHGRCPLQFQQHTRTYTRTHAHIQTHTHTHTCQLSTALMFHEHGHLPPLHEHGHPPPLHWPAPHQDRLCGGDRRHHCCVHLTGSRRRRRRVVWMCRGRSRVARTWRHDHAMRRHTPPCVMRCALVCGEPTNSLLFYVTSSRSTSPP